MKAYIYYNSLEKKKNKKMFERLKDNDNASSIGKIIVRDVCNHSKATDFHYFWNGELTDQLPQLVLIAKKPDKLIGVLNLLFELGVI